ncbi:MAG: glycoside hydrolase family 2 TIM barrel-domain containing protein [Candidatus Faecousia sp.]|nr:glycoside hydrolase family 2 [Clostridiales bacterium]MDY6179326.1 glycoside hydrolase family 2 TIM barrel-domain containing protein [Candidatus Faecousia sp.]
MEKLTTPRGEALTGTPWTAYPRPQMRREQWWNLNGEWEFGELFDRKIRVPFCPEAPLSGIGAHFPEGSELRYRKKVTLPHGGGRLLLHFGGVDQQAQVYINGKLAGEHEGGYEAFTLDVTDAWREGENEITVLCRDDLRDRSFPYGKQTMTRGGMWYTPVSGIWQTVWMERVPQTYIEKLRIVNRGASVTIDTGLDMPGTVTVAGLGAFSLENGKVTITPEKPRFWSPEDPWLYEFTVEAGEDRVASYFALRTLEIKTVGGYPRLCLNGKPYFFHGLLDQGYWPDGLLTPAAPECYADDILAMKKLGFNTLRKHIKVEPEEFYYQCDKLGMVVFQDMVNNGHYRFFRDTALPTLGVQKLPDGGINRDGKTRRMFLKSMEGTAAQLGNHPCILYWTIFNEGWGQFCANEAYEKLKALDGTRWIDTTSGWFRGHKSDVDSRHVYFRRVKLRSRGRKPLVLSEFGGKTWRVEGHVFNPDKTYGYGACPDQEALGQAVEALYREEILPCVKQGLCAAIYTQVSDVEDEINGLLTYDRKLEKLTPERMLPLARALQQAMEEEI